MAGAVGTTTGAGAATGAATGALGLFPNQFDGENTDRALPVSAAGAGGGEAGEEPAGAAGSAGGFFLKKLNIQALFRIRGIL